MTNSNQFHTTSSIVSSKQLRNLNFFWLGFIIYSLGNTLSSTSHVNIKICQAVQIPGLILMFTTVISLIQFKFDNQYIKFIYVLYCTWFFTLILNGFNFLLDYTYIKDFLFNPYIGMLYFSPLILLFPRNLVFYKKIFDVIFILGIFYLIYDIIFIKDLINADRSSLESQGIVEAFSELSFSCGFLLLTYAYHSKKRQLLALGIILLALLFAIIRARRGLIFMYASMIFFSYLFYIFHTKKKLLIIYLTIFIALLGAFYISGIHKLNNSSIFGFLIERGIEDSRKDVELYFYDDMKTKDWVIGKGIKGEYFCPNLEENQITNYRQTIETGYLQTILNGGLISVGLFLFFAIPAFIKGLFYSKNILSKAAAIWILMSLINSYPATINSFTLKYLLVWVSIGICYSKEIRNLKESTVKNIFQGL